MTANFLLDTNVLSATAPSNRAELPAAKQAARDWVVAHQGELFLAAPCLAEVAAGIGQLEAKNALRFARELAGGFRP